MATNAEPPTTNKATIKERFQQGKQRVSDRAARIGASLKETWLTVFPERSEVEEEHESGFFQGFLQVILWLAFAAFLLASLPHVAYFFATFEPQNSDGTISDYWWFVSYALAVAIDVTAFLLSLNVAIKMRRATSGLPWYQKIIPAIIVIVTHWPFIVALVAFSWLVNYEHAKEFHSSMLATAEAVTVNLLFWRGTIGDLNPVIASAFPVLAVAYTGMSDQIGDQRKRAVRQRQAVIALSDHAAQTATVTQPEPTVVAPDWQTILRSMQEMNAQTLQAMQTMQQQSLQVTVAQFTKITIEAVREVVEQAALPAPNSLAQIEAPKTAQIDEVVAQSVGRAMDAAQEVLAARIKVSTEEAIVHAMRNAQRTTQTSAHEANHDAYTEPQLSAVSAPASIKMRAQQFIEETQRTQNRLPDAKEIMQLTGCALRTAQLYLQAYPKEIKEA